MAPTISSLKKVARIAVLSTLATTFVASTAAASTCGRVNGTWTTTFNNSVYDCDANGAPQGPTAECNILTAAQACCAGNSSVAQEKACICAVYNDNTGIINGIGISDNQC